jgi:hypothetical protein
MQDTLFPVPYPISAPSDHSPAQDDISLTFNTALIRTRSSPNRCLATELSQIAGSPACSAIFKATQQLAQSQDISELDAAEQVIRAFRRLDEIWGSYLNQEGLARLKSEE